MWNYISQKDFFKKMGYGEIFVDKRFVYLDGLKNLYYIDRDFYRENLDFVIEIFEEEIKNDGPFFGNRVLLENIKNLKNCSDFTFLEKMDRMTYKAFMSCLFIPFSELLERCGNISRELDKESFYLSKEEYNKAFSEELSYDFKNFCFKA